MSQSPVAYLEERVEHWRAATLTTPEACLVRDAVVHELLNCIFALQVQAINALHVAQLEAGLKR